METVSTRKNKDHKGEGDKLETTLRRPHAGSPVPVSDCPPPQAEARAVCGCSAWTEGTAVHRLWQEAPTHSKTPHIVVLRRHLPTMAVLHPFPTASDQRLRVLSLSLLCTHVCLWMLPCFRGIMDTNPPRTVIHIYGDCTFFVESQWWPLPWKRGPSLLFKGATYDRVLVPVPLPSILPHKLGFGCCVGDTLLQFQ